MLEVREVSSYYGPIRALDRVSIQVRAGSIVSIVGANGAGKTTLLNTISGLHKPQRGSIWFLGREITRQSPEKTVRMGIIQAPEGRQLFSPLTVQENLELGAYARYGRERKSIIAKDLDYIYSLFPVLYERSKQLAGTLSGGEQQMLAIGRALMGSPKLLLLDEPSLGLAPLVVQEIFRVISQLRRDGATVMLVEQNAWEALRVSDWAYVMETGAITMEGPSRELIKEEKIKLAFLGKRRGA